MLLAAKQVPAVGITTGHIDGFLDGYFYSPGGVGMKYSIDIFFFYTVKLGDIFPGEYS